MPDGVVDVLPSRKSGAVVSAMLNDPRVRKLSFTGSTEVGRILLREAADTVVNTSITWAATRPSSFSRTRTSTPPRGGADRQDAQRRRGMHRRQRL